MSKLAYAFGDLAEPELAHISRLIPPGTLAIDAGSHYGDYTLALARAVGPSGEVWAIDPSVEFMSICRANAALNEFTWVAFFEVGLAEAPGTAFFEREPDPSRSFLSESGIGEAVRLVALDDLMEERAGSRPVSFIKLDIEGSELAALQGAIRTIRIHRPTLMIEVQAEASERAGHDQMAPWRCLERLGYTLAVMQRNGALRDVNAPEPGLANYIARPSRGDSADAGPLAHPSWQ